MVYGSLEGHKDVTEHRRSKKSPKRSEKFPERFVDAKKSAERSTGPKKYLFCLFPP